MPQRNVDRALLALIALLFLYVAWVSLHLGIETFDTFEIFMNARTLAGRDDGWYYITRFYGLSLLFSPVFYLEKLLGVADGSFAFVGCHVVELLLFAGLLFFSNRLFRMHLTSTESLAATLLLTVNPLIIHLAPVAKEDIPAALYATGTLYFYLKARQGEKPLHWLLAGVFATLAMATRYNLAPFVPTFIVANEIFAGRRKPTLNLALLVCLPPLIWLLLPALFYPLIGHASFFDAPLTFFNEIRYLGSSANSQTLPYPEYATSPLVFLAKSFTIPVLGLVVAGLISKWRKTPGVAPHAIWFLGFLALQSLAIYHKEARYLFPLFPSACFLAVIGFRKLARWPKAPAIALGLLALQPAYLASAECLKFRDPFYRVNFEKLVSRHAAELAGNHDVFWVGKFYALHPKDYVFDEEDCVTYLYHFFIHQVRYYTGKPMRVSKQNPASVLSGPSGAAFPAPQVAAAIHDGDVVIANPEKDSYTTKDVPVELQPLIVERAHVTTLAQGSSDGHWTAGPGVSVVEQNSGGIRMLHGAGFAPGAYEIFVRFNNNTGLGALGAVEQKEKGFSVQLPGSQLPAGAGVAGISLLSFDSVSRFSGQL